MKFPDDVRQELERLYKNRHRQWLAVASDPEPPRQPVWPLEVTLGIPTENQALKQIEDVRTWVAAWQSWHGPGSLGWSDRRWRRLGVQRLPGKLFLNGPDEVAQWAGEADRWRRARHRYTRLVEKWPQFCAMLPRYSDVLSDYGDVDFRRLVEVITWLEENPLSGLYPRQLPVRGLDSKWLEKRKGLVAALLDALRDTSPGDTGFHERCGLSAPPPLVRLRLLDEELRQCVGGLSDFSVPLQQLSGLRLPASTVYIVENLQTGLAFDDLPGSVVIMQLGYGVDVLGRLPWLADVRCVYWGDLDTHGFAILNRARSKLPGLESVLMDEQTLISHRDLWVDEKEQHAAETLPLLTDAEQAVYQGLKRNIWGQQVRLEQERIAWDTAWKVLSQML